MDLSQIKNIFFTADLHFGHKSILEWCSKHRPWSTVEEMEDEIVSHINAKATKKDLLYILGDLSFTNTAESIRILKRINCKMVLVPGNHDKAHMKSAEFREQFVSCKEYIYCPLPVPVGKQKFAMFHFPIYEWDQMQRGTIHLHGHVHGKPTYVGGKILDVGWDAHGKILHLNEVMELMKDKPIREH